MRLDADLCRVIMLTIEGAESGAVDLAAIRQVAGCGVLAARRHCWLLVDGGYAEPAPEGTEIPMDLTQKGRDFCDLTRDAAAWQEAKDFFPDGKFDFEWITEVLIQQRDQRSKQACSG
jgi:hypothetical protein